MKDTSRLQRALAYEFSDTKLLALALTHRSAGSKNNERLEFLGDSIVNHIVAEALYRKFPEADEGDMSRMRASLVKGDTLAEVARELNLGEYLLLGPGERKSGGHRRDSILADALEAVSGAILLDGGVERCRECILALFQSRLEELAFEPTEKDPKTALQEYLQGRHKPLPSYELLHTDGNDHNPQFHVKCSLQKPSLEMSGTGGSRRKAEQAAAQAVLQRISKDGK
ncbi:MAG: ribonuclease III [Proteobacteria bacterium]|nr:ribonuclease III [Pseudomonadota bacterium]